MENNVEDSSLRLVNVRMTIFYEQRDGLIQSCISEFSTREIRRVEAKHEI